MVSISVRSGWKSKSDMVDCINKQMYTQSAYVYEFGVEYPTRNEEQSMLPYPMLIFVLA